MDDRRGHLSEICDLYSRRNPQINEKNLHHSVSMHIADLETKERLSTNHNPELPANATIIQDIKEYKYFEASVKKRTFSDAVLTSTLDHFPWYRARHNLPLKGLDTKESDVTCGQPLEEQEKTLFHCKC